MYAIRSYYAIRSGGAKINFGANLDFVHYTNRTIQTRYYDDGPLLVDYNTTLDFVKWGLFAQANQSLFNDRLSLSLGIRTDARITSYNVCYTKLLRLFCAATAHARRTR